MSDRRLALHTQLFEQFPDPLCIVGKGFICDATNAAFIRLCANNQRIMGHPLTDLNDPAILKQILPPLERCFSGEIIHDELHCVLSNGTSAVFRCWSLSNDSSPPHYVALSLSPIQNQSFMVNGAPKISLELEKTQRLLTEANRRNVEMKAALRHQAAQNSESQRRKDEFLSTIGHQLRNHLSPVRNAARFLHHKLSGESDVGWCISVIDRQVSQFARLVEELQDLARLESGHFELNKDRLPITEVISQAVEWVRPILDEQHQTLEFREPENFPFWVDADLQRLAQAFEHLLHNAAHYSGANGRIRLDVRQEGTEVVITICDHGYAISPDLLARIFDVYGEITTTAEQSSEREPLIGMAVVRRVVELHNGTVRAVYLDAEQGNERMVRLPMAPPPVEDIVDSPFTHLVENTPTNRILVVDDNEDVAISFGALLEVLGHDVRVVLDGRMALDVVRDFMPSIVFLDIAMPDMDGYEVARRLRAEHQQENLRLVAVTGYGQEHDAERAQRAGFDHHLLKPVDLKDLQALLGH